MLNFQIHSVDNISFLGGTFDNQIFSLLSRPISKNSNAPGEVEASRQAQIQKNQTISYVKHFSDVRVSVAPSQKGPVCLKSLELPGLGKLSSFPFEVEVSIVL